MPHPYPVTLKNTLWMMCVMALILSMYSTFLSKTMIVHWTILSYNTIQIQIPLIIDPMGTIFSSVVLFISANIMHFTKSYMKNDLFMKRFCLLIVLFISSMNFLIFIPHMMAILLGWDGLGITSFILVIYYQNPKSLAAGMITALTNRIGDAALLISIAWTFNQNHWSLMHTLNTPLNYLIIPMMILAAITKSAQIPFSSWLPAAMAAPTPVSALVHSSTLVTAGVFLLLRFYHSIDSIPMAKTILLFLATITMFMAGMSAMFECDMKKIIALSTLSQLGVMIGAISFSLPTLAYFHLITHAMFKALLFMSAGTLISLFQHSQDLRAMGSLSKQLPLSMSSTLLASSALCGMPFLAGFYSKDMILEMSLLNPINNLILTLFFLATALTAAYSTRFLIMLIWSPSMHPPLLPINDEDPYVTTPMITMSIMAISVGAMINWFMLSSISEPFLLSPMKTLPLMVTMLGIFISMFMMTAKKDVLPKFPYLNHFGSSMWFLSPLSTQNMLKTPMTLSHLTLKTLDHGWIESISAQGGLLLLSSFTKPLTISNFNIITSFMLMTVIFIWSLLTYIK